MSDNSVRGILILSSRIVPETISTISKLFAPKSVNFFSGSIPAVIPGTDLAKCFSITLKIYYFL